MERWTGVIRITYASASAISFVTRWWTNFNSLLGNDAVNRSAMSVGGPPSTYEPVDIMSEHVTKQTTQNLRTEYAWHALFGGHDVSLATLNHSYVLNVKNDESGA